MKRFVLLFALALSGCSSYELLETQSYDATYVNSGYQYSDSNVTVTYNFWRKNGMMNATIFNNLNVPIYVDWKTSNFIYNGTTYTYWDDRVRTESEARTVYGRTFIGNLPTSYSQGGSVTEQEQRIISIAPHNSISVALFQLSDGQSIETGNYSQSDSPIKFRNYLYFSTDEHFASNFSVDNSFYVSKVKSINKGEIGNYQKPTCFFMPYETHQKGSDGSGF